MAKYRATAGKEKMADGTYLYVGKLYAVGDRFPFPCWTSPVAYYFRSSAVDAARAKKLELERSSAVDSS